MVTTPISALLVDDAPGKLKRLERQLEDNQDLPFRVVAFANPYEAFTHLLEHPGSVEFAFIDHVIRADRPTACRPDVPTIASGIDLARAISSQWPGIGIILYSGDAHITEQDQWNGLAAGAHRYVRIQPPQTLIEAATREFLAETRELREVRHTLRDVHSLHERTDILQRSVRVGISLIDRRFKVWYTNADYDTITGRSRNVNRFCSATLHNRSWPPCRGCLVAQCLGMQRSQWEGKQRAIDRVFYGPTFIAKKLTFKYVHSWAQPVYPRDASTWPIAVLESVIDLTDSPTIGQMSLEENLDLLFTAITELTCEWLVPKQVPISQDGRWNHLRDTDRRPGYTRVRVYRADVTGPEPVIRLIRANQAHEPTLDTNVFFKLKRLPVCPTGTRTGACAHWVDDIAEYLDAKEVDQVLGCSKPPLESLLFDSAGAWIGWLAMDAQSDEQPVRALDRLDARFLRPYAEEIARILERKLNVPPVVPSDSSSLLESIQSKIVLAQRPPDALQTVMDGIVGHRNIEAGHIRIIKGNSLELAAVKGSLMDGAPRRIPADASYSLSRPVAKTGLPLIINKRPDPRIETSIDQMPDDRRQKMDKVRSLAVFPLVAFGRAEGALWLCSTKENVFSAETVVLCSRLAEMASYALHDTSLQVETQKATSVIWQEAAASFAHRIGNTLPEAQFHLGQIQRNASLPQATRQDANKAILAVNRAMDIATRFRKHGAAIVLRRVGQRFDELVHWLVDQCRNVDASATVEILPPDSLDSMVQLSADRDALADALRSFVRDSVRFHPHHRPDISVAYAARNWPGPRAQGVIRYIDNGPGIPNEQKSMIFDPFFTTSADGTGIGLTDAKAVVHAHDGTMREIGLQGDGVCFEILLPLSEHIEG